MGGGIKSSVADTKIASKEDAKTWTVPPKRAALRSLLEHKLPVVIDDFHYLNRETQTTIIRSLKDPVFEGLPVILLSVPHRAFDAVKIEREMTGRVNQLPISLWDHKELEKIADVGFKLLGVRAESEIVERLVEEIFGSPHLMQTFCNAICLENGIVETVDGVELKSPSDWREFFKSRATSASKTAFERLAMGPRQRADRIPRRTKTGDRVDIYRAILLAIAGTGPKTQLSYEEIRSSLREVLIDLPQSHEITRVLEKMTEIARDHIEGEPVVEWDKLHLHISDPFFAYYLKWGVEN